MKQKQYFLFGVMLALTITACTATRQPTATSESAADGSSSAVNQTPVNPGSQATDHATSTNSAPARVSMVLTGDPHTDKEVTASIDVADVSNLYAYQIGLSYDPKVLQVSSVAHGGFLSGATASNTFSAEPNTATPGVITGIAETLVGPNSRSGSGTLATVHFTVLQQGDGGITLGDVTLLDAKQRLIPVEGS